MATEKTIFIKAKETETGITLKHRIDDDTYKIEDIELQNYFYIRKEDFPQAKSSIARFSEHVTSYSAENGEFAKIYFNDNTQRNFLKKILENRQITLYEADINAVKRYLLDYYDNHTYGYGMRYLWYDIETDDRGSFDKDENNVVIAGKKQILSIALENEKGEKQFYFYNKNPDNHRCDEEFEMLSQAFEAMKDYDVVSAWNANMFDRPYIEQRLEQIKQFHNTEQLESTWSMLIHIDELLKFKNLDHTKFTKFSLEHVANVLLGDGKIDFSDDVDKGNGGFYQLFKTNPKKFKEYNLKDVTLMRQIDEKRTHLSIVKHLSSFSKIPFESFMFNSQILDLLLTRRHHESHRIQKSKPNNDEKLLLEKIKPSGGYTFCVDTGFFKMVYVYDFKSHYPLMMATFNISNETFVKNMWPSKEDVEKAFSYERDAQNMLSIIEVSKTIRQDWNYTRVNNEIYQIVKASEVLDKPLIVNIDKYLTELMFTFIDNYTHETATKKAIEDNLILAPADFNKDTNGWLFHPHRCFSQTPGVLAEIVTNAVVERDKIKYKLKQLDKNSDEYYNLEKEQNALKVLANSAFGFSGFKLSRYFDYDIADSITSFGRYVIKKSLRFAEQNKYAVIGGDSVAKDTIVEIDGVKQTIEDFFNNTVAKVDTATGKEIKNVISNNVFTKAIKIKNVKANKHADSYTDKAYVVKRNVNKIIRHKINKKMYRVTLESGKTIDVTEDHSMIVRRNKKIENPKTKDLKVGDSVYVDTTEISEMTCPKIAKIEEIEYDDYVYDLEVDDAHTFLANDIFVHNTDSIFTYAKDGAMSIQDLDKAFYDYYSDDLFSRFNLKNDIEFKNPHTNELQKHHYFCVFEYEKTFQRFIMVAKKRYYFIKDGELGTMGGAFKKIDTNPLAVELQKQLCLDIMEDKFDKQEWSDKLSELKNTCFNNQLDVKYLQNRVTYSKHYSTYGGVMLDSKTGKPKITKDGRTRQKNIPCYIKLAERLDKEQHKPVEIGDALFYIIGSPEIIGLKPESRKKVDRELFASLYDENDLDKSVERLQQADCEFKYLYDTKQRAITIDEYLAGEKYDATTYWSNIMSPLDEILNACNITLDLD